MNGETLEQMQIVTTIGVPTGAARLCFSLATRPGRFGATVHNAAFRALGLDFFYKPLAIGEGDLLRAIDALRLIGARGWAVTMPFKEQIVPLLDTLSPEAAVVGAVNTVVNDDGVLCGYNTDVDGATVALDHIGVTSEDRVLILGIGGVARAILQSLKNRGVSRVVVACRRFEAAAVAHDLGARVVRWDQRDIPVADVLINATSIGMGNGADMPIDVKRVSSFRAVMDVVAQPVCTALIIAATAARKSVVGGDTLALGQAVRQFELYTGQPAPLDVMRAAAASLK